MINRYDAVVIGGAIAGASTALLLRRRHPELRILVIERDPAFDWKVGESTVEVSSYFLTRVLKLYDYLSREQLPKQAFRYWFHNGDATDLRSASEVGPYQLVRLPSFQLDRAKFDEHVLALAAREGADLWRPAKVLEVRLAEETGESENVVVVERDGQTIEVRTPWVVDASGRAAILARKRGWLRPLEEHPTSSVWARYKGVKDLDSVEAGGVDPDSAWSRGSVACRRLATNHFTGYGYWMWFIPLQGGETSIGAVWDRRLVQPPGTTAEEKLNWFIQGNPLTREMVERATLIPDDLRMFGNLPYLVDRNAGKGWSLVGDAAGFLDPFYSPGLDQMAFSVSWTLELIGKSRMKPDPMEFGKLLKAHNEGYSRFFRGFFATVYRDKYYLMGDYDTMTAAFLLDTALYYFVAVWPLYKKVGSRGLLNPPFYGVGGQYAVHLIGFYQRRLISIAKRKRKLGIYGNRNNGRHPRLIGFSLGIMTVQMFMKGLRFWFRAELANLWTYVFPPRPMKSSMPMPAAEPFEAAAALPIDVPNPVAAPGARARQTQEV
ncbi:MAG: NAD(P)/FAD-dependent oxidoreductase [Planctomycetes bacterium]|nr:NAD(P)/FAD-dependent oxidoreductase [Planctomycetota bacterium]